MLVPEQDIVLDLFIYPNKWRQSPFISRPARHPAVGAEPQGQGYGFARFLQAFKFF